jgi:hypothetical protein
MRRSALKNSLHLSFDMATEQDTQPCRPVRVHSHDHAIWSFRGSHPDDTANFETDCIKTEEGWQGIGELVAVPYAHNSKGIPLQNIVVDTTIDNTPYGG